MDKDLLTRKFDTAILGSKIFDNVDVENSIFSNAMKYCILRKRIK